MVDKAKKAEYNREYHREYRQNNKDAIARQQREYRQANKEAIARYQREYYQNNIQARIAITLRSRARQALNGIAKSDNIMALIGCTTEQLKQHLEAQFVEGMTWDNYGFDGWHIDHIKPCASFDLTDPEQQKLCFHYTNLQPLWAEENLSKGASIW